jgi:hypothetical protein
VRSVPRSCKQEKPRVQLVVRQLLTSKYVNKEAEEATALVAATRRQPVKVALTENA